MPRGDKYFDNFEELVTKYQRRLYLYALRILRNHEDAEDAVQDAFVRAYRALAKGAAKPPDDARLTAWLFKITLNVARYRLHRKQLAQRRADEMSDSIFSQGALEDRSSPDVILDRHSTIDLIEHAIRELPLHLLGAAWPRFIEDLSHSEIAQRRSEPVGTVKSHVLRARRLLRQTLQPVFA